MEAEFTKDVSEAVVYNISDVEIFSAGVWNGDEYTEKDLDDMVQSFNEIGNKLKPYIKLGHNTDQNQTWADGMPAAGWITGLKRVGEKLLATFSNVPEKIYKLIEKKAYGRFSAEIYWNLKESGNVYRRALKAVALLGSDMPAVTNLDDFINLYNNTDYESIKECNNPDEVNNMDEKVYTEKIEALEKQLKETSDKLAAIEEANKEYAIKIDAEQQKVYMAEVSKIVDEAIKTGKFSPAQREIIFALVSDREAVHKYSIDESHIIEGKSIDLLKQFVASQPNIVPVGEGDSKAVDPKSYQKTDDEIFEDKIKNYMQEHKVSYRDAFSAIANEAK